MIMLLQSAEASFRGGMELLEQGRVRDALGYFSGAIEIQRTASGDSPGEPRYLSYYGLCLGITRGNLREALECCRSAASREPYNGDAWWNLGRVALIAGRRGEAYRALHKGLDALPGHGGVLRDLERLGVRRPPVLSVVGRSHPLNVMLGRLRARWVRGRNGQEVETPTAVAAG
jgi:tetratricopeptide (TPR) repeat protein